MCFLFLSQTSTETSQQSVISLEKHFNFSVLLSRQAEVEEGKGKRSSTFSIVNLPRPLLGRNHQLRHLPYRDFKVHLWELEEALQEPRPCSYAASSAGAGCIAAAAEGVLAIARSGTDGRDCCVGVCGLAGE